MSKEHLPTISKNNSFNFIRLVCALIVIYEHAVILSDINVFCLNIRDIAVDFFFILSGFWVTSSYIKSKSYMEFFLKRIRKIFPLYWIVVITISIILVFSSSLSIKEYFLNSSFFKYLFANLITLNFLYPNLPGVFNGLSFNGAVNGSLWTIKVEIGFYICLPLILLFIRKIEMKKGWGHGWIVLFLIYISSIIYSILCNIVIIRFDKISSLANQLPAFMSYFVSGMLFCLYWDILYKKVNIAIIPAIIITLLIRFLDIQIIKWIFEPISLSIIVIWIGTKLTIFSKVVERDFSYSMYLIHFPIIQLFNQYSFFENNVILSLISVFGITFLFSYILEKIIGEIYAYSKSCFIQNPS